MRQKGLTGISNYAKLSLSKNAGKGSSTFLGTMQRAAGWCKADGEEAELVLEQPSEKMPGSRECRKRKRKAARARYLSRCGRNPTVIGERPGTCPLAGEEGYSSACMP